jgi:hypothetical protein
MLKVVQDMLSKGSFAALKKEKSEGENLIRVYSYTLWRSWVALA